MTQEINVKFSISYMHGNPGFYSLSLKMSALIERVWVSHAVTSAVGNTGAETRTLISISILPELAVLPSS